MAAAPKRIRLVTSVHEALGETAAGTPAACLALVYARNIDRSTHVRLALDKALRTIQDACAQHDAGLAPGEPSALDAFTKIAAALSAVTVAGDLGPKLLAALDALLLTPKATAAVKDKLPPAGRPANPLEALRGEQDELKARRDRRTTG